MKEVRLIAYVKSKPLLEHGLRRVISRFNQKIKKINCESSNSAQNGKVYVVSVEPFLLLMRYIVQGEKRL